ncbi:MAG: hypothetical protein M1832_000852 [Thelocarpon impressellum]|nr:MAG: hypothetical protein M1832_000852 [Thelocarpon impressellum]
MSKVSGLVNASSRAASRAAVLEIALPCPALGGQLGLPRSRIFGPTQTLLAGVYRLICIICVKEGILTDGPGGVDARVLLLAHSANQSYEDVRRLSVSQGPMIDLPTLALCRRPWVTVYSLGSEAGEVLLGEFLALVERQSEGSTRSGWAIERVPGGIGVCVPGPEASSTDKDQGQGAATHVTVAVGGTFDHLHAGHKLLLTMTLLLVEPAFKVGGQRRRMIVGISGDRLLKNKRFAEQLESWSTRQTSVAEFVWSISEFSPSRDIRSDGDSLTVTTFLPDELTLECVCIQDPFGPTVTDEAVSALVVSQETRSGGKSINAKRKERGWNELAIYEVDVLDAQEDAEWEQERGLKKEFESKISSTEIRRQKSEQAPARA